MNRHTTPLLALVALLLWPSGGQAQTSEPNRITVWTAAHVEREWVDRFRARGQALRAGALAPDPTKGLNEIADGLGQFPIIGGSPTISGSPTTLVCESLRRPEAREIFLVHLGLGTDLGQLPVHYPISLDGRTVSWWMQALRVQIDCAEDIFYPGRPPSGWPWISAVAIPVRFSPPQWPEVDADFLSRPYRPRTVDGEAWGIRGIRIPEDANLGRYARELLMATQTLPEIHSRRQLLDGLAAILQLTGEKLLARRRGDESFPLPDLEAWKGFAPEPAAAPDSCPACGSCGPPADPPADPPGDTDPPADDWWCPGAIFRHAGAFVPGPGAERFTEVVTLHRELDRFELTMELTPAAWSTTKPRGNHNVFWLHHIADGQDFRWKPGVLGYFNLFGRGEKAKPKLGASDGGEFSQRSGRAFELVPGETYHVVYRFDAVAGEASVEVVGADGDRHEIARHGVGLPAIRSGDQIQVVFGHTSADAAHGGPEVPTFGWSYSDVCLLAVRR